VTTRPPAPSRHVDPNYKWIALSNTTLGILMAAIDGSIVIIALPAIFNGIQLNPLEPGSTSYLLWIFMGYLLVTAVLVVAFGWLGDRYGRVKMYTGGFLIFTIGSILLAATPFMGTAGALWIIAMRIVQGIGGAFLFANSAAILTDAFPTNQRGLALGINGVAAIAGQFIGLLLGGFLATIDWRLVFFVSVPIGIIGTIWAYLRLEELSTTTERRMDWWGNLTFGFGLAMILIGITYGIQPYGNQPMGWTSPLVIGLIGGGILLLALFVWIEQRVSEPFFDLSLFRIRAFAAGNIASLLAATGRGGLSFIIVIWLQGIWLPVHGYSYADTPLWAGIFMLPLTAGFLIAGPLSGYLSDRFGARLFATGGMILAAIAFIGLTGLPVQFAYPTLAFFLLLAGLGSGLFNSPNAAAIMNSVPANQRGAASGMRAVFANAGFVVSIGLFFSLMIAGLAGSLSSTLYAGLVAHDVPIDVATQISHLPPVSSLFASLLGYNPMASLLPPDVLKALPPDQAAILTGKDFFPNLISGPFHDGLVIVFLVAAGMSIVAAIASALRGGKYVHQETSQREAARPAA
jgi:MFS family permease